MNGAATTELPDAQRARAQEPQSEPERPSFLTVRASNGRAHASPSMHTPLPDCYVAGAPKCGTSSLCSYLHQHPRICMSRPKEVNVLARDDFEVNPYPFFEASTQFECFDWDRDPEPFLKAYESAFQHREAGQLLCDGTPSYLASKRAGLRMKQLTPSARIIVLLRHPTVRAYSQYWHQIRHRRATLPFEAYMRFERVNMRVGFYREHLERYYSLFEREQILVVTAEELKARRSETLDAVASFLGIEHWQPDSEKRNGARVPRLPLLQYALNLLIRTYPAYYRTLDHAGDPPPRKPAERIVSGAIRGIGAWNMRPSSVPPMDPAFRRRLDVLFERENRGLSKLVGKDFASVWQLDV